MKPKSSTLITVLWLVCLLLSACDTAPTPVSVVSEAQIPAATQPPAPTATLEPPTPTPPPLTRPGKEAYVSVYDPSTRRVLLFSTSVYSTDAWAFDAASGNLTRIADRPAGGSETAAFNHKTGQVLLYFTSGPFWTYDPHDNTWSKLPKNERATGGPGFPDPIAYDSESDKVVLFTIYAKAATDTFDSDTASWMQMKPEASPNYTDGPQLVYDSESDRVILWHAFPDKLVWAYDVNSNTWEKITYTGGPSQWGGYYSLAYAPDLDRVFVYYQDQFFTYDYNHNLWEQAQGELKPGNRVMSAMTYDLAAKKIVLYGGVSPGGENYDDLWLYDPQTGAWTQQPLP